MAGLIFHAFPSPPAGEGNSARSCGITAGFSFSRSREKEARLASALAAQASSRLCRSLRKASIFSSDLPRVSGTHSNTKTSEATLMPARMKKVM